MGDISIGSVSSINANSTARMRSTANELIEQIIELTAEYQNSILTENVRLKTEKITDVFIRMRYGETGISEMKKVLINCLKNSDIKERSFIIPALDLVIDMFVQEESAVIKGARQRAQDTAQAFELEGYEIDIDTENLAATIPDYMMALAGKAKRNIRKHYDISEKIFQIGGYPDYGTSLNRSLNEFAGNPAFGSGLLGMSPREIDEIYQDYNEGLEISNHRDSLSAEDKKDYQQVIDRIGTLNLEPSYPMIWSLNYEASMGRNYLPYRQEERVILEIDQQILDLMTSMTGIAYQDNTLRVDTNLSENDYNSLLDKAGEVGDSEFKSALQELYNSTRPLSFSISPVNNVGLGMRTKLSQNGYLSVDLGARLTDFSFEAEDLESSISSANKEINLNAEYKHFLADAGMFRGGLRGYYFYGVREVDTVQTKQVTQVLTEIVEEVQNIDTHPDGELQVGGNRVSNPTFSVNGIPEGYMVEVSVSGDVSAPTQQFTTDGVYDVPAAGSNGDVFTVTMIVKKDDGTAITGANNVLSEYTIARDDDIFGGGELYRLLSEDYPEPRPTDSYETEVTTENEVPVSYLNQQHRYRAALELGWEKTFSLIDELYLPVGAMLGLGYEGSHTIDEVPVVSGSEETDSEVINTNEFSYAYNLNTGLHTDFGDMLGGFDFGLDLSLYKNYAYQLPLFKPSLGVNYRRIDNRSEIEKQKMRFFNGFDLRFNYILDPNSYYSADIKHLFTNGLSLYLLDSKLKLSSSLRYDAQGLQSTQAGANYRLNDNLSLYGNFNYNHRNDAFNVILGGNLLFK